MKSRGHTLKNWRSQPRVTANQQHLMLCPVRTQTSTRSNKGENPSGAAGQHVPRLNDNLPPLQLPGQPSVFARVGQTVPDNDTLSSAGQPPRRHRRRRHKGSGRHHHDATRRPMWCPLQSTPHGTRASSQNYRFATSEDALMLDQNPCRGEEESPTRAPLFVH